jgi:hypothetical protein
MFSQVLARHIDLAWAGRTVATSPIDDVLTPIDKSISSALAGMKRKLRLSEKSALEAA